MNVRVQSRPPTREAALEFAREQYVYCSDFVDSGYSESKSVFAAAHGHPGPRTQAVYRVPTTRPALVESKSN
jgi:hypothetical protein